MKSYIIEKTGKLQGTVTASGSKNSSLPILAATILNNGITKLYNVPNIQDTKIMLKILEVLGCKIKKNNGKIVIDSRNITKYEIPEELMSKMRSSVILAGALIGRKNKAVFSCPGGCDIGARPIDLHLKAFKELKIKIKEQLGLIKCECEEIEPGVINLDFPSVGATENAILASVISNGTTMIINAAMEPEIVDLQKFLNKMGAKVSGAGSNIIKIIGVKKLHDASYNIMPDRIEVGTLLCAAAVTGGNITIKKVIPEHLSPVLQKLEECGCKLTTSKNEINLQAPKRLKAVEIKTMPYPGFPTDMQSIFASILSNAKGTSVVIENIFENRYKYTNELKKMGAKITIEGKAAIIKGKSKLHGANVLATDLRRRSSTSSCSIKLQRKNKNRKYRIYIKRL